jgi:hypothetical protein
MLTRRSFLSMLGIGAVAAPVLAKAMLLGRPLESRDSEVAPGRFRLMVGDQGVKGVDTWELDFDKWTSPQRYLEGDIVKDADSGIDYIVTKTSSPAI